MISTKGLALGYAQKRIIHPLDIGIEAGKVTSIIGPNGCGKSTFLKGISRIIGHQEGHVYLNSKDIHTIGTKDLAKQMAVLPQTPQAPEGLKVKELVAYGRFPHSKRIGRMRVEDDEKIAWALEVTNLTMYSQHEVDALSGGQRQRVWIAMALAQETELILLDEPTTYLDMAYQLEVLELLQLLNQEHGTTIVMVLHDINQAARFSDHLIAFKDGHIVASGNRFDIMNEQVLKETFGIEADIVYHPKTGEPLILSYGLCQHTREDKKLGGKK